MNEKLFSGYIVKGVQNIADLEIIINQMKEVVQKRASISYQKLLKWQIERIFDEISLNQIQRPETQSILDIAISEVRRRIAYSGNVLNETEFDLYIGVQIMCLEIDGQPTTMLKVISPNDIYSKGFRKINELIPYEIYSDDLKRKCEKHDVWNRICDKYAEEIPFVSNLINYEKIEPDIETIRRFEYRSPEERAYDIAEEKLLNHLLSAYACEQEIPPMKLAEYTVSAINRMSYQLVKDEIEMEKEKLMSILKYINFVLISTVGIIKSDIDVNKVIEEQGCETEEGNCKGCEQEGAPVNIED